MNINQLAWRNLWRRKRRTFITTFSIAFGVMLAVTVTGAGDYFYTRMIDAGASMGMGHISIEAEDYNRAPSLKKHLVHVNKLRQQVLALPEISDVMTRITGQAMFASANKSIGGVFIAIDPAQENRENNLFIRSIIMGENLSSSDGRSILIGSGMARKLHLKIGKKVVYTTTDIHGEIVSAIARVHGIFETGVDEVDSTMVLLPIHSVQKTVGYHDDEATLLAIMLKDQRTAETMRDQLAARHDFSEFEVLSWQQSLPELASMITVDKSNNYISQLLIGLIVAAGILNTMLMSVLERNREFGVMMALGMAPRSLFQLVMLESFWLAIIGLVCGSLISIPWYIYMTVTGIDLTAAYGDNFSFGGVLIDPIMKIRLFKESAFAILFGLFALALTAGIYPAWRSGRIPPVESMKAI